MDLAAGFGDLRCKSALMALFKEHERKSGVCLQYRWTKASIEQGGDGLNRIALCSPLEYQRKSFERCSCIVERHHCKHAMVYECKPIVVR